MYMHTYIIVTYTPGEDGAATAAALKPAAAAEDEEDWGDWE